MSHPTSKCIRLDRTLSFAHVTRKSQLPCWTASELSLPNAAINIDDIATQTLQYMAVFKEHLSAIQGHPQQLGACECLLKKRGAPHPQQLTDYAEQQKLWMKMEDLIQRHATMVDEHLAICCAVNTLLLLQEDIISSLPEYKCREIEHRMDLISGCKPAKYTKPSGQFGPFVPRSQPVLERPQDFRECDITESVDSLLDLLSLPKVIGVQFLLKEADLLFCVNAIHLRLDGFQFSVQYEDIREPDIIGPEELKRMLQNSKRVS
ncbi:hypothetical protein SCLCIDRAFT_29767 [Scleroderma citrinum Foug A]|uniref:Uncharacterized protein n=1 Tax=Scleroderma citrinum Foug A TaxID=1036808 RepID=A0A0C2Z2W5_9AGAM|nr:hypothetical protein SCLCIDRAFT_29767 [Scleroderma citrinum Foug A]